MLDNLPVICHYQFFRKSSKINTFLSHWTNLPVNCYYQFFTKSLKNQYFHVPQDKFYGNFLLAIFFSSSQKNLTLLTIYWLMCYNIFPKAKMGRKLFRQQAYCCTLSDQTSYIHDLGILAKPHHCHICDGLPLN